MSTDSPFFTYLGSVISRDGNVEADFNTRLAKAAAVVRRLDNVWRYSTLSLKIKLDLYTSLIVSTAIYASETWKSTARIRQQLDVFHQSNLRKILGITWKDHVTNLEVLSRTEQRRLQDIVAERRLLMAGHITRMPPGRPANHAMSWTPRGSGRRRGRPTMTWRSTFKEDLVDRGVDWNSVRTVAWLPTGAGGELLLPIVLSRIGGSKCLVLVYYCCWKLLLFVTWQMNSLSPNSFVWKPNTPTQ